MSLSAGSRPAALPCSSKQGEDELGELRAAGCRARRGWRSGRCGTGRAGAAGPCRARGLEAEGQEELVRRDQRGDRLAPPSRDQGAAGRRGRSRRLPSVGRAPAAGAWWPGAAVGWPGRRVSRSSVVLEDRIGEDGQGLRRAGAAAELSPQHRQRRGRREAHHLVPGDQGGARTRGSAGRRRGCTAGRRRRRSAAGDRPGAARRGPGARGRARVRRSRLRRRRPSIRLFPSAGSRRDAVVAGGQQLVVAAGRALDPLPRRQLEAPDASGVTAQRKLRFSPSAYSSSRASPSRTGSGSRPCSAAAAG